MAEKRGNEVRDKHKRFSEDADRQLQIRRQMISNKAYRKHKGGEVMEIYVVTSGEYSDYHIDAVFTDISKAEMYCAVHNGDSSMYHYGHEYRVEAYKSADNDIEDAVGVHYKFTVYDESAELPEGMEYDIVFEMSLKNANRVVNKHCFGRPIIYAEIYLTENDPDLAFKIGKDMIAKYKAEQEGL